MNTAKTLLEAMKILGAKGIKITQISVTKELGKRMIDNKKALGQIDYKKLPLDFKFADLDDEFDNFIPVELAHLEYVSKQPDNFIGCIFTVDIFLDI